MSLARGRPRRVLRARRRSPARRRRWAAACTSSAAARMGTTWNVRLVAGAALRREPVLRGDPGRARRGRRPDEHLGARLRPVPLQPRRARHLAAPARRLPRGARLRARRRRAQRRRVRSDRRRARRRLGLRPASARAACRRPTPPRARADAAPAGAASHLDPARRAAAAAGRPARWTCRPSPRASASTWSRAALAALGIESHLVEVGGELRGSGVKPDGQPWWVRLEHPDAGSATATHAARAARPVGGHLRRLPPLVRARRHPLQPHRRPARRPAHPPRPGRGHGDPRRVHAGRRVVDRAQRARARRRPGAGRTAWASPRASLVRARPRASRSAPAPPSTRLLQ